MIDRRNSIPVVAIVTVLVSATLAIAYGPTDTARSQGSRQFVFETVGSLDGSYNAIARTADGYLLLGGRGKVDIVDAHNPATPRVVGTYAEITGDVPDIVVNGHEAYASSEDGLLVLDVTDPDVPIRVGQFLSEPLKGVAVQEDLAVVAGSDRVYVVDVSDPSHPRELSSVEAKVVRLVRSGDTAFLGGTEPVLTMLGISDPGRPSELGRWDPAPGGWGGDVAVDAEEDLAYVGRSVPRGLLIPPPGPPGPICPPAAPTCTSTPVATRPASEA
jgi:hypothetical protein